MVTRCIFIIPIVFRLFAISEFISIVNNRKNVRPSGTGGLGSILTGRANVKTTASLLYQHFNAGVNAPIDKHVFQKQRVVFYAVKLPLARPA